MAEDVEGRMTEEPTEEEPTRPLKQFVVRCEVQHAMGGDAIDFMDTVPAYDSEGAKDFVAGWMAEKDHIVKRWIMVGDAEQLGRLTRNLNP